ncbi:MAG: beta-ketoacyl-[acyl-carrier-protein] synthase family protein [Armatimonadota bacterium]|jgi:3-oxoacyl-[acyl-carrier-protein] synthase II
MQLSRSDLRRRVVITGLGVVSSTGMGKDAFWEAVRDGRSGIRHVTGFDCSDIYSRVAGQITDFDPTEYMTRGDVRRSGKFVHYSVAAAHQAVDDAGIDVGALEPFRVGTVFGSSVAANGNLADGIYEQWGREGAVACGPTDCVQLASHAATSHVFISMGMRGPNLTVGTGCCSGLDAIAKGRDILQTGQADVMVVGASEACVSRFGMSLLCKTGVLTRFNEDPAAASRPYDARRDGLVLSEGAGAVVLETAEHALERDALIYAEVRGYGTATEARHLVIPDPSGIELAQALRSALMEAHLDPTDLDYVCAHGIANVDYDRADTRALKMVLGEHAYNIPVSSIKSTTGQPFAAGGMWQTAAACMAIQTDTVPPTINYQVPDPECDLDYVPNRARPARVDTVLMNSHSFGGTHAALLIRSFKAPL